jgi:hypothetical protein
MQIANIHRSECGHWLAVIKGNKGVSPLFACAVRKGAMIQWEEDIPTGNCCSSRKQSKRGSLVTARHEAFDAKGSLRRTCEHVDHNENEHRASLEKGNVAAESVQKDEGRSPDEK